MVNEENDSGFENMLMTPLEIAIPLNLEEALFPSQPSLLPVMQLSHHGDNVLYCAGYQDTI